MEKQTKNQLRGSVMLLLAALFWGVAFAAQSKGMDYVGPFTFNGARSFLGVAVLLPLWVLMGRPQPASGYDPKDAGKYYGGCAVDNQAFFDKNGKATEALKVFGLLKEGSIPDGKE